MAEERPVLVFRKHRGNRFTLPALLGILESDGVAESFAVALADSREEIRKRSAAAGSLVAYSFMTPNLEEVREEVEWLRARLPSPAVFLAGGPHASGDPQGTLRLGFDYVFAGESEETLPRFLRGFLDGKTPRGRVLRPPAQESGPLVHPPHSLRHRFFAPLEITRGCLYRCTFCQTPRIFGRRLRHRSPENAASFMRQVIPYGYDQSKFTSPNAFSYGAVRAGGPDLGKLEEFLLACREAGIQGVNFGCYPSEVRPDWVTPEALELVRRHCRNRTLVLGAQSGSDRVLTRLKRGHTVEQSLNAARWIREAGFTPHVDFVFGFPEETPEDRRLSLEMISGLIRDLGARIHTHTYMPLPGTPLFQKEPTVLDPATKNALSGWEKMGRMDGWWKEQEALAWKIVGWRDRGVLGQEEVLESQGDL